MDRSRDLSRVSVLGQDDEPHVALPVSSGVTVEITALQSDSVVEGLWCDTAEFQQT